MLTRIDSDLPEIFSGLHYQSPSLMMPNEIIRASRIDQALCDEAEHGRIHGHGIIENGCWMLHDGQIRICLNQGYRLAWGIQFGGWMLDCFFGGNPLIEECAFHSSCPLNEKLSFIQFPYLWASTGADRWSVRDPFGLTFFEYQQAAALGARWNLGKNWGEANRLPGDSNWHEDVSILTTMGDGNGVHYFVYDAKGNPQYAVEIVEYWPCFYLLPYRYLKRPGFWRPRRVFFPPEEEIAIWYLRLPDKNVKNIILTMEPFLMLENNFLPIDTVVGCLPGGTPSICKTDFTTLHGKECWVPVWAENNRQEVEFAVKLSARLRREYLGPHIVIPGGYGMTEIPLEALAKLARQHDLFVPEELDCEYLGDLTEAIASGSITPVIENVLNEGEAVLLREHGLPPLLLASHIASQAERGKAIFGKHWKTCKATETLLFIDACDRNRQLHYKSGYRVYDCRFCKLPSEECLRAFRSFIETARLVIFAAPELLSDHTGICVDVIRICLTRKIGVLILSENELPRKLERLVMKTITASRYAGQNLTIALTGDDKIVPLEVEFDADGECRSVQIISEEKREFLNSSTAVPSLPPDSSEIQAIVNHLQLGN